MSSYDFTSIDHLLGTSVILTSNPRNPTGKSSSTRVIATLTVESLGQMVINPELAEIQDICRDRATLIVRQATPKITCLDMVKLLMMYRRWTSSMVVSSRATQPDGTQSTLMSSRLQLHVRLRWLSRFSC